MTAWASGVWGDGVWRDGVWEGGTGSGGTVVTPPSFLGIRDDSCSIVHTVHTDDAVLTASTEMTTMAAVHLQTPSRDEVWRSTDTNSTTIRFTFADGLARGFGFWGLFFHRLFGARVQMELFTYADWTGSPIYDSGVLDVGAVATPGAWGMVEGSTQDADLLYYEQPVWQFFAPMVYAASGQLTITGVPYDATDTAVPYYEIGRLVAGPYYQFGRGVDFVPTISSPSTVRRTRSFGGSNRRNAGARYKRLECNMRTTTREDHIALETLMEWMANGRDGVLTIHTGRTGWEGRTYMLNGCFTTDDAFGLDFAIGGRKLVFESN